MTGKRLKIDGRPATITGEWEDWESDEGRSYTIHGYYYRHDGEARTHHITTSGLRTRSAPL